MGNSIVGRTVAELERLKKGQFSVGGASANKSQML
jgi:hypothetical protein